MIKKIKGNIFNTTCQTMVNTVNCVGAMGKGIALECKLRFPDMFKKYKEFCDKKLINKNEEKTKDEKNSEMVDSLDQFLEDDEIDRKN